MFVLRAFGGGKADVGHSSNYLVRVAIKAPPPPFGYLVGPGLIAHDSSSAGNPLENSPETKS